MTNKSSFVMIILILFSCASKKYQNTLKSLKNYDDFANFEKINKRNFIISLTRDSSFSLMKNKIYAFKNIKDKTVHIYVFKYHDSDIYSKFLVDSNYKLIKLTESYGEIY
jgi:hypothetical protein